MKSILYLVLGVATLALATLMQSGRVAAEEPPRPSVKFASAFPVSGTPRQYELVQQILDFPPGAATREHSHGGPAFVTVLEGQSTIREGNVERVYGPGETYTEVQGAVLTAFNRGNVRTRVLASFLLSPGAPQTLNRPDSPAPAIAATPTFLSRSTFGTQPAEFEVRQVVNEFGPGAVLPFHTHGGPGIAMVIEGEITFDAAGMQLRRTPGGFFVENDTTLVHQARNTGAGNATTVVTFLIPKGAPMTTFVTAPSGGTASPVLASPSDSVVRVTPPSTGDGGLVASHLEDRPDLAGEAALIGSASALGIAVFHLRRRLMAS